MRNLLAKHLKILKTQLPVVPKQIVDCEAGSSAFRELHQMNHPVGHAGRAGQFV